MPIEARHRMTHKKVKLKTSEATILENSERENNSEVEKLGAKILLFGIKNILN